MNTAAVEPVLVTAVQYDRTKLVKVLIDAGADVNTAAVEPVLVTTVLDFDHGMT